MDDCVDGQTDRQMDRSMDWMDGILNQIERNFINVSRHDQGRVLVSAQNVDTVHLR